MKIYLASPLGFSELGRIGLATLKYKLLVTGHEIIDPWELELPEHNDPIAPVGHAYKIGEQNREMIDQCDCVLAVLDGQELDCGTVAELAYAVGRGKKGYGYRGDFRNVGEFEGTPFNLQVYYFIQMSGGKLFRSLEEIDL